MGYQSRINVDSGTNTSNISELLRQAFALKHLRTQQQQSMNQQQNVGDQLRRAQDADALAAEKYKQQMQQQQMQQNGPFIPGISQMPMNQQNPMRQQPPKSLYQALLNNPSFRLFAEQNGLGQFVENQAMQNMIAQSQGGNDSLMQTGQSNSGIGSNFNGNPLVKAALEKKFGPGIFKETPEQRRLAENQQQLTQAEEKSALEARKSLPTHKRALLELAQLEYLGENPEDTGGIDPTDTFLNHNFWGLSQGLDDKSERYYTKNTHNPKSGLVDQLTLPLIAGTAKELAPRGSVAALGLTKENKPSKQDEQETFLGKTKQLLAAKIQSYNDDLIKAGLPPLTEKDIKEIKDEAASLVNKKVEEIHQAGVGSKQKKSQGFSWDDHDVWSAK